MKTLEKKRAIELRKLGLTFSEILKDIAVSKGSLSYWLRDIKLTPEQLMRIEHRRELIKEKFVKFNESRKKRAAENKSVIINNAAGEITNISEGQLKLVGLALYWAEGSKGPKCPFTEFTNTDPAMIRLMMRWFREICLVQESNFRVRIQLHNREDTEKAKKYWSEVTRVPISQFTKTYTKISPTSKRRAYNIIPYGICSIRISGVDLITRIHGWLKGITALSSSPV